MSARGARSALAALVVAGCGGGSSSPPPPPPDLALRSSTPASGATGVLSGAIPQLTFSAPVDAATAAGVTLTGPLGAVAGAVGVSGSTVTFTPARPLAWDTRYTLSASTALRGADGRRLPAAVEVSFTTRELTWKAAAALPGLGTGPANSLMVKMDGAGNALAAWCDLGAAGTSVALRAARRDAATGTWGSPAEVVRRDGEIASLPALAVAPSGDALLVWVHYPMSNGQQAFVRAARYSASTDTWSADEALDPTGPYPQADPRAAMDGAGNALAAWVANSLTGTTTEFRAARREAAGGAWGAPELLASAAASSGYLALAAGADGEAVAAWSVNDSPAANHLEVARRGPGASGTWTSPAPMPAAADTHVLEPRLALDGAGVAHLVWFEFSGTANTLLAARGTSSGWSAPATLASGPNLAYATLAVHSGGTALAGWANFDGTISLRTSRLAAGATSWSAPFGLDDLHDVEPPLGLAMDAAGNAVLAFTRIPASAVLATVARLPASGSTWSAADLPSAAPDFGPSSLAVAPDGSAVMIWTDGTSHAVTAAALTSP